MSSLVRRIQRSVKRSKGIGVHFQGRGSRLGDSNEGDKCLLARTDREAKRAAGAA